jgi:hypothetical protein
VAVALLISPGWRGMPNFSLKQERMIPTGSMFMATPYEIILVFQSNIFRRAAL